MPRLDKVLSMYQLGSRSTLKKDIRKKGALVNHQLIKNETFEIKENDVIVYNEYEFRYLDKIYLMMNKQEDKICSHDDLAHSIYSDLVFPYPSNLFTVGRLDKDTTGLLLITNDGQWAHKITHKDSGILKRYHINLEHPFDSEYKSKLFSGIDLKDDGFVRAETLEVLDNTQIILGISQGKYHQVKRMMHAIENEVVKLHRLSIGKLHLDNNLEAGESRALSQQEIEDALWSEEL